MVLRRGMLLADFGMDVLLVLSRLRLLAARAACIPVRRHRLLSVLGCGPLLVLVVTLLHYHHLRPLDEASVRVLQSTVRGLRLVAALRLLPSCSALGRSGRDVEAVLKPHLVDPLFERVLCLPFLFQRNCQLLLMMT